MKKLIAIEKELKFSLAKYIDENCSRCEFCENNKCIKIKSSLEESDEFITKEDLTVSCFTVCKQFKKRNKDETS